MKTTIIINHNITTMIINNNITSTITSCIILMTSYYCYLHYLRELLLQYYYYNICITLFELHYNYLHYYYNITSTSTICIHLREAAAPAHAAHHLLHLGLGSARNKQ